MSVRAKPPTPKKVLEKVGLYLPPELAQELRFEAVRQRRKISAVAEDLIREGLSAKAKAAK